MNGLQFCNPFLFSDNNVIFAYSCHLIVTCKICKMAKDDQDDLNYQM